VAVQPRATCSFTGRINVPTDTGLFKVSIQLSFLNQWGGTIAQPITIFSQSSPTTDWTLASYSGLKAPDTVTKARVLVKLEYMRSAVYVDAFSLTCS
jgi:hypothetical protein